MLTPWFQARFKLVSSLFEASCFGLPLCYASRHPAQPVPLSMIAPVGQTSAARRADFLRASAIGLWKGVATDTWNPRPMNDSPRSSPAWAATCTQAPQMMHLPGSKIMSRSEEHTSELQSLRHLV